MSIEQVYRRYNCNFTKYRKYYPQFPFNKTIAQNKVHLGNKMSGNPTKHDLQMYTSINHVLYFKSNEIGWPYQINLKIR